MPQGYAACASAQIGEAAFAAAWDQGRWMTVEQIIVYAPEGSGGDSLPSIRTTASNP